MNDDYRKLIQDADAARAAANQKAMDDNQKQHAAAQASLQRARSWLTEIFELRIMEANAEIRELHAQFLIVKTQQLGPGLRCEFRFKRHQRESDTYVLNIANDTFTVSRYFIPSFPAGHGRQPQQPPKLLVDSEVKQFKSLKLGNDDAAVPEILSAIIRANVK